MAHYRLLTIVLAGCLPTVGDRAAPSWEAGYDRTIQWFNHAEFEHARTAADSGYRTWCGRPQSRPCWQFRLALAESLIELDRIKEALPLLQISALFSEDEARRLSDLAMVHLRNHEDDLALQCLARARGVVSATGRDLLGKIYLIAGTAQLHQDQISNAEDSFRRALAAVEGSQSLIESYTLSDLGFLDLQRFRYDEALYWFGRARDLARRNGMRRALEVAFGNLGATFLNLGDVDRAIQNLGDAWALSEELHDRGYGMRWLVLLGESWYQLGDAAKAAGFYQRARLLGYPDRDQGW
jgi:tetratricopeptide (TPR) repeat protein